MEKRSDIQIFEFVDHPVGKEEMPWDDNKLYTPLQVGAVKSKWNLCDMRDDRGTNNSDWNWMLLENTGAYWIMHNVKNLKYVGTCSYRRRLSFDEDFDFDAIFKDHDAILPEPYKYKVTPENYGVLHVQDDFDFCMEVLLKEFPEYKDDISPDLLYYSSGLILPIDLYVNYYAWLYSIFIKMIELRPWYADEDGVILHLVEKGVNQINWQPRIKYNIPIFAYLQERLFSIWVKHNLDPSRIFHVSYNKINCA